MSGNAGSKAFPLDANAQRAAALVIESIVVGGGYTARGVCERSHSAARSRYVPAEEGPQAP